MLVYYRVQKTHECAEDGKFRFIKTHKKEAGHTESLHNNGILNDYLYSKFLD